MLLKALFLLGFSAIAAFSQVPAIEPGVSEGLAKWRATQYSNISYKLNLTLEKMSPVLKGTVEIRVTLADPNSPAYEGGIPAALGGPGGALLVLDWREIPGYERETAVWNVTLNGNQMLESALAGALADMDARRDQGPFLVYLEASDHLIFRDGVKTGENIVRFDFQSPILTSGSAITRYIDKEDGSEYIYSLFVPSDASTAFPVFDQPDLKARFELNAWQVIDLKAEKETPIDWQVISNASGKSYVESNIGRKAMYYVTRFPETKPISTYVFAFAAGPFEKFDDTGGNASVNERALDQQAGQPNRDLPAVAPANPDGTLVNTRVSARSIYVRKSQAAKFKPHAAEVFRLNREAVKYLETYFDYKFPFPKYDLVLIPEFPFGGMEHAGATFLREQSVIFPQEPTKNDIITRANLIFHEAAHQWFGDVVTMRWFDDLWLKEGFATFMAYKALEAIMPEADAWKVFYERVKQAAYQTDSTRGTTAIYQPIANLNSAKSAYGNIVYNKAPAFLRQAEFYLGEDKFQTAVRAFLKKHEFGNAGWEDLVREFEKASGQDLKIWANTWIKQRGVPLIRIDVEELRPLKDSISWYTGIKQSDAINEGSIWTSRLKVYFAYDYRPVEITDYELSQKRIHIKAYATMLKKNGKYSRRPTIYPPQPLFIFPNYQDYGYGIFLLDDKSRDYVLKNIGREKDDFLRTMMWGSLWDSVREGELDPKEYVELVIKYIGFEKDEGTIQTLLTRVTTAMNYYVSEPPASVGGKNRVRDAALQKNNQGASKVAPLPPAYAGGSDMLRRLEDLLIDKIQNASTQGQRITYYRAFLNIASTDKARKTLKQILKVSSFNAGQRPSDALRAGSPRSDMSLRTKDKFDIVARLAILGDADAAKLLADIEKTETSDDAKRYAYAARAAFTTPENKAKFWNDFVNNKDISESWIEAAVGTFNSIRHSELTLPYLERALAELPKLKRDRKIFFVNDWLYDFIGGQRDETALAIVNKFLAENPNLDNDLRLKILENVDVIERAVKIRAKYRRD